MTKQEASERYSIPVEVLAEYEALHGFQDRKQDTRQYGDQELESISMIMTLHDVGFDRQEVEAYMKLLLEGDRTKEQRIKMLNQKRENALDEIHFKEAQLARLDYLRYNTRKA